MTDISILGRRRQERGRVPGDKYVAEPPFCTFIYGVQEISNHPTPSPSLSSGLILVSWSTEAEAFFFPESFDVRFHHLAVIFIFINHCPLITDSSLFVPINPSVFMFVCLCQSFREKKILPYIRSKIKVVLSFVHNLHKGFLVFLLKEFLTAYIHFIYLNKLYRNFFFFFLMKPHFYCQKYFDGFTMIIIMFISITYCIF